MKPARLIAIYVAPLLVAALPGCLATQSGSLEVLNPAQSYGQSVAIVGDFHRDNEAIETRLASDLRAAFTKRGLTVVEDPAKADLVVLPTLGRMRDRAAPPPVEPVSTAEEPGADGGSSEADDRRPAWARLAGALGSGPDEPRAGPRLTGTPSGRPELTTRRSVPSARAPAAAQQAGLLLTAVRSKDYRDYGSSRQSLPPVWRIYVSQPATQMKWNSVAVPLINAAANAARPLGKSKELEAGSTPTGDQRESREEKKKDPSTDATEDEEPEKKKKPVFRFFGRPVEQTE